LRAALVRLEAEGLVESIPTGGFSVREFTENDIYDAIEIRGTFEGLAARMAAESAKQPKQIEALHSNLLKIDGVVRRKALSIDDFSCYLELNARFHAMVLEMAGSQLLRQQMQRATSLPFASPSSFVMAEALLPESHDILFVAQDQHHCLLEAIEAGEGARAEAIAREHARIAKRNLQVALHNRDAHEQVGGSSLLARMAVV